MLKEYKFKGKTSESKFERRRAVSTVLGAVIVGVIGLALIGAYFYSTGGLMSPNAGNDSTTTTLAITTTSKNQITPVEVTIVSGAHLQTQSQHYVPDTITVEIGVNNTITWMNMDGAPHTVTSDSNTFNSGTIAPGSNFTMTFTSPGTYLYHCSIHPFMSGTVIVLNANGQTVSSTQSSTTSNPITTTSTTSTSASTSCAYYYGGQCY